jgi:hypothetical protein
MSKLSPAAKENRNSSKLSNDDSLKKLPYIHEEEEGIQFFGGKSKVRVANRLNLRRKAYKLIYNNYSKMGITRDNDSGLWLSIFDALPETTTIVVEDTQGEIVGTLTLVFESPIGLPADALYRNEIDEFRATGRRLCEIISFGIDGAVRSSVKIIASLIYSSYLFARRVRHSTDFIITVSERYENFYCRNLLFKKIGPVRSYAKVNGKPTVLLNLPLDLPEMLQNKRRIFPLYLLNYSDQEEFDIAERIQNMHKPISDEEFYTFFIEKTDIWAKASPLQKEFIKKVYPLNKANHYEISRALARAFSKKNQSSDVTRNGNDSAKMARQ